MSLINNSAHTLEDVEKLYKELRLTSLYHAISKLNNYMMTGSMSSALCNNFKLFCKANLSFYLSDI